MSTLLAYIDPVTQANVNNPGVGMTVLAFVFAILLIIVCIWLVSKVVGSIRLQNSAIRVMRSPWQVAAVRANQIVVDVPAGTTSARIDFPESAKVPRSVDPPSDMWVTLTSGDYQITQRAKAKVQVSGGVRLRSSVRFDGIEDDSAYDSMTIWDSPNLSRVQPFATISRYALETHYEGETLIVEGSF